VTQLFEWFATGQYSLKTLAAKARRDGLQLGSGKLHSSTLHQILRKRIYSGDFDWDGVTYHGTQTPLVTVERWQRVQEILNGKTHPRTRKHDFPYSGIVTCGHCGCAMVAEIKKGKYVYYHCTGGKGTKCPEPYTREERLTEEITAVLAELVIPKAVTDWLRAALRDSDITETRAREQAIQHAQQECDRLNQRIEAMYLDKLDGRITAVFYDAKAAAWRDEEAKLRRRITELRAASQNFESAIRAIEETSQVCKAFPTQPATEQRRLLKILVDSATWKGGEFDTTLRTPFQKLRLSNRANQTNEKGKGVDGAEIKNWLPDMDSNHELDKILTSHKLLILKSQ
jgi:hypothetical protein